MRSPKKRSLLDVNEHFEGEHNTKIHFLFSLINDIVGKCNCLDKYGYHYTPRQYFEDNLWLTDSGWLVFFIGKTTNQPPNTTSAGLYPRVGLRAESQSHRALGPYTLARK